MRHLMLIMLLNLGLLHCAHSHNRYYLCGSDEDGCRPNHYQYCVCIPYNEEEADKPYCLDFATMTCTPATNAQCTAALPFKNQNECLATLFQSEATPPCRLVGHDFCIQERVVMCDENGQIDSCKIKNAY